MVPAIILAAGRSARFGSPKALAAAGDTSFVRRIVGALREGGAAGAVVVVREDDRALQDEVARDAPFARAVPNPDADRGQLSSLLVGLDAVDRDGVDGVIVTLVDMPLVSSRTVRTLLERSRRSHAPVVRAVHDGRHGHPVVFRREAFAVLRGADPSVGAKAAVRALATEDVEVADRGVVEDVDTPGDYARLFGES
jgi:CTP:molybdopterin cytidylyltransferase MocA